MITKTTNPQYDENIKAWIRADDVYNDRIKQKGKKYLPGSNLPKGVDCELEQFLEQRYNNETLPLAVFYNFTNLTLMAAVGAIMRKPPNYQFVDGENESTLDYLTDNADGKGNGLTQVARHLLTSQYLKSRGGLLISNPQYTNLADLQSGEVAPRLIPYDADQITDWATEWINGKEVLTFLQLVEKMNKRDYVAGANQSDGGYCYNEQLRVIEFNLVEGKVFYSIEEDGEMIVTDEPVNKNGTQATSIPFHIASSVNNDWTVDPSPLRTMVDLNLQHYIMYNRDMQGRHDLAQLQLSIDVGTEPTAIEDFKNLNPSGIMTGSAVPILTRGGSVSFLQASESNLLAAAPERIESMAVKAGAQLFQDSGSNETATSAEIRASSTTATMSSIASNCGDCIYNALVDLAGYVGFDESQIKFQLNDKFFDRTLSAQEQQAYMQMVMQGLFPQQAYYEILKKSGDLAEDVSYEDYLDQLRESNGMGGMPDVSGGE
ncbi:TMhelix containing protein [Vibrio phage 1.085.O._10N.222.51.E3]|nr:TMhelix containing protein [Vibrio phage 1.085.O._10N.222.51.E3]AUR88620.1 TMhelix containing protein [Vibrio phage 1.116.O._10N.222.52.C10]AUR92418.1 TMhelix containing protein [Vibrio phage 1.172.O._10N.261.52.F5]AUR92705.1 TMhelix containing protein [Vibrio phage 1.176.O._10N.261.55.F5]